MCVVRCECRGDVHTHIDLHKAVAVSCVHKAVAMSCVLSFVHKTITISWVHKTAVMSCVLSFVHKTITISCVHKTAVMSCVPPASTQRSRSSCCVTSVDWRTKWACRLSTCPCRPHYTN